MKAGTAILGVIVVGALAGGAYWFSQQQKPGGAAAPESIALASPAGITFQTVRVGKVTSVDGASSDMQQALTVFADTKGMTLYTFDKDQAGKSTCNGECATGWPPLVAPADAKPVGDWSVIARDDGAKQWAVRGKPVYTFAKDAKIGDSKGNGVESWHMAMAAPDGLTLPYGLGVQEVAEAAGQALVDKNGMALYTFDGDAKHDKVACAAGAVCKYNFVPVVAGQLANAVGNFTVVGRSDGMQQWAYKGKLLYAYDGDVEPGDANGKAVDKRFQLAMVMRYFMPDGIAIRLDEKRGGLLTTAEGKTLYSRDTARFNGTGGHSSRGGARGIPAIGMAIGVSGCDAECEKVWLPLKAPADAQASGYWTVIARPDGAKQWAYQGYALYTFTKDQKPGDTIGHDMYDLAVNDSAEKVAEGARGLGLYWRVNAP